MSSPGCSDWDLASSFLNKLGDGAAGSGEGTLGRWKGKGAHPCCHTVPWGIQGPNSIALDSTQDSRTERKSQSTGSLSPDPSVCCNEGAAERSRRGKNCVTCKLRARSWSCLIWFGLAAKIHSWQWKHFHPFQRCWGSPPSVLKRNLNFPYDLILHKAPAESGVSSSSPVERHSPWFLNNPRSATTGTC